jgi:membrane-associated protein
MILRVIEIFLHLDKYLQAIVDQYSALTYGLIFLIIFLETGIVVTPFLPGDSLLFTAGALAAINSFDIGILFLVILFAAILGDTANYHIGKYIGPKVFNKESSFFFHKEHLARAQKFYEKYGKKAIIIARFVPIMRTFAPFVAGIGKMSYRTFIVYNIIGGTIWCGLFTFGGYLFGNIPWVKENFGVIVIAIIFISCIPVFKEIAFHYWQKRK